jgi:VIT1/CCC1 family predicted Fe2+/Mn2+ transporter
VVPFLLFEHLPWAMRTSNLVAVVMLFVTGSVYGTLTSHSPWILGTAMVLLGCVLVGVTIALGG